MLSILEMSSVCHVRFQQCMYGLGPPDRADQRIRKDTVVLGNVAGLVRLARTCDRRHMHAQCYGGVRVHGKWCSRAKLAGAYPHSLCSAWAKVMVEAFKHAA